MSSTEIELESAVDKVLQVLTDDRLTIRESHIVLGRAARRLLEMDLFLGLVRAEKMKEGL